MRWAWITLSIGLMLGLAATVRAGPVFDTDPSIVVELVPDNPGPYYGGERVTVDIWLHSQVTFDDHLEMVRLDFWDTSPGIALDPALTFDLTSLHSSALYDVHPELPLPWLLNEFACFCPGAFLRLASQGSLRIADVGMTLPTEPGRYVLDVLNADEPQIGLGADVRTAGFYRPPSWWRAYEGDIVGGVHEFVIIPEPATLCLVGLCGGCIWRFAGRSASRRLSHGRPACARCEPSRRAALSREILLIAASVTLGLANVLRAEPGNVPVERIPLEIDSGLVSAAAGGVEPVVVFAETVSVEGAPWVRLHFGQVQLSGSPAQGNASFIRLISTADNSVQLLDSGVVEKWHNSSATFNGSDVRLELLAYPGTGDNRVAVDEALVGAGDESAGTPASPCPDTRAESHDARAGRLLFWYDEIAGCTAWLFNGQAHGLLTAGHCCNFFCSDRSVGPDEVCTPTPDMAYWPTVEFNVPLSEEDGALSHPPAADQYAVDLLSVRSNLNTVSGLRDWCYFGVHPYEDPANPSNTHTPLQKQGASFRLASVVPPADGRTLRITGYGGDFEPGGCDGGFFFSASHMTQQTATGPFTEGGSTALTALINVQGGNSGSPCEDPCPRVVYGIMSKGGCVDPPGEPHATCSRIDMPELLDALACPRTVNEDCNDNGVPDPCDVDCGVRCGTTCTPYQCDTSDDCNDNGIPDECEFDCDDDGIPDDCELPPYGTSHDYNENQIPDECENVFQLCPDVWGVGDCNQNCIDDVCDIAAGTEADCNADDIPDSCQYTDNNANGIADVCEDCNHNGIPDFVDIDSGYSRDWTGGESDCCTAHRCSGCDDPVIQDCVCGDPNYMTSCCEPEQDGGSWSQACAVRVGWVVWDDEDDPCGICAAQSDRIPDECQWTPDCDDNGIPDVCDLEPLTGVVCDYFDPESLGTATDCNENHVLDRCDIERARSGDCNLNGVPDECEIDENAVIECQGVELCTEGPFFCEPSNPPDGLEQCDPDCNGNGFPDGCDIGPGLSEDCQPNGIPDDCDIAAGTSQDCGGNGVPDECQDCNANGVGDECDLTAGTSCDKDGNGVPDECWACCEDNVCRNMEAGTGLCEGDLVAGITCAECRARYLACCYGSVCELVSECECIASGGFAAYQPGDVHLPVVTCDYAPCAGGACCDGAHGDCIDMMPPGWTQRVGEADCQAAQGTYVGNAWCDDAPCTAAYHQDVTPDAPLPDPKLSAYGKTKVRYLSFLPGNPGAATALRVTLTECAPYPGTQGRQWWVGPAARYCENGGERIAPDQYDPPNYGCHPVPVPQQTFIAATLQCDPYYRDWQGACRGTCDIGARQGGVCGQDDDCRASCVAGYCVGAERDGEVCDVDTDCREACCSGVCNDVGSHPGSACVHDDDCLELCYDGFCQGGERDGEICDEDDDCRENCVGRSCAGGFTEGDSCTGDGDCTTVIHVFDEAIVPSVWNNGFVPTTYRVEAVYENCNMESESSFSHPLNITMSRWGDAVSYRAACDWAGPDFRVDVSTDVSACLDKFKNLPCAPMKARCDMEPELVDQRINISDVTVILDAFLGHTYPPYTYYEGPSAPSWTCP